MSPIQVFEDRTSKRNKDDHINGLAWNPFYSKQKADEIVVMVTAMGFVKSFDLKKGKVVSKFEICANKSCFGVDWATSGVVVACEENKV